MFDTQWPQGCEGRICREEGQMSVCGRWQKTVNCASSDKSYLLDRDLPESEIVL